MARRLLGRRIFSVAAATMLVVVVVLVSPAPTSAAPAEDAGAVVIVRASGSSRPLSKGSSADEFSFRLPDGASCPGDSANEDYRVQSYMVPDTVASDEVTYDGLGPTPIGFGEWATFRQPFYDTATRPFSSAMTAEAVAPGQPGAIINIPTLSFGVYSPGEMAPGRYRIGVACTLYNKIAKYWDAELVVSLAADKPAGFTWAVVDPPESSSAGGGLLRAGLVGLVAAVVFTGLYARRRSRRTS